MEICARTERRVSKSDRRIWSNTEVSRKGRQRERTPTRVCFGLPFFSFVLDTGLINENQIYWHLSLSMSKALVSGTSEVQS